MKKPGDKVLITYRGTCAQDATFLDERGPENPLEVTLGSGGVFPPIESALYDMVEGETRQVAVPAKYGFGEADAQAVRSFPLIAMPRWQQIEADRTSRSKATGPRCPPLPSCRASITT